MYMDGVIKDMNCPTNAIWDRRYICRVPQMATITELEVNTYGLRVTGQAHLDAEMYDMDTNVGICINDMLELRALQYPIRVVDPKEAVTIYNAIHHYLSKFTERIEQKDKSMIHTALPYEDLELLDQFADELYDLLYIDLNREVWDPTQNIFINNLDLRTEEEIAHFDATPKTRTENRSTFINYFEERYKNA